MYPNLATEVTLTIFFAFLIVLKWQNSVAAVFSVLLFMLNRLIANAKNKKLFLESTLSVMLV
jgi:uncharacterized membrane protein YjjP (DUF1212 family)